MSPQKDLHDGEQTDQQVTIGSSFKKKLTDSGGSDGVALHIDAPMAREYNLNPETEVEISVVEEAGDVSFHIDIPAGFTYEDLEEFADRNQWTIIDRYVDDDGSWSLTYQNDRLAQISIDSNSRIDGHHVNNVIINGAEIELLEKKDYLKISSTAFKKELDIKWDDSDGLWQRLRGSNDYDTDDAPDEETIEQLIDQTDLVTAQFVARKTLTRTTLEEIGAVVEDISAATEELDAKISGNVRWLNSAGSSTDTTASDDTA